MVISIGKMVALESPTCGFALDYSATVDSVDLPSGTAVNAFTFLNEGDEAMPLTVSVESSVCSQVGSFDVRISAKYDAVEYGFVTLKVQIL